MSEALFPARLLWPSNAAEARQELERIGATEPWRGPLGTPVRNSSAPLDPATLVALRLDPPIPALLLNGPLPAAVVRTRGENGFIATGLLAELLAWVEAGAEETSQAVAAVRAGAGLDPRRQWCLRGTSLDLGPKTLLMAVINTTPDSFWSGSRSQNEKAVEEAIEAAVDGGADLLDIGGESTRPGAEPLAAGVEIERVLPAVEKAVGLSSLPVSIDTRRREVAAAAIEAGAVIVNDISAGTDDPALLDLAASSGAGLVLMHRRGLSATMQDDPRYDDLMGEISAFLARQAAVARAAGVAADAIAIDPGLGFGKRRQHNFELYRRMAELHSLGYPLLVGPSRKRHLSGPADRGPAERLPGTLAACALLAREGVQIVRAHDVGAVRAALDTADEIRGALIEDRVS